MSEALKFDEIIQRYFDAVDKGYHKTIEALKPFIEVYLQLIGSGIDPKKARWIMDLYLE